MLLVTENINCSLDNFIVQIYPLHRADNFDIYFSFPAPFQQPSWRMFQIYLCVDHILKKKHLL